MRNIKRPKILEKQIKWYHSGPKDIKACPSIMSMDEIAYVVQYVLFLEYELASKVIKEIEREKRYDGN